MLFNRAYAVKSASDFSYSEVTLFNLSKYLSLFSRIYTLKPLMELLARYFSICSLHSFMSINKSRKKGKIYLIAGKIKIKSKADFFISDNFEYLVFKLFFAGIFFGSYIHDKRNDKLGYGKHSEYGNNRKNILRIALINVTDHKNTGAH